MKTINFIVPCYNESGNIIPLYETITSVMKKYLSSVHYKLIMIDDGSTDQTLDEIKRLAVGDEKVKYVSFSRNFGKEAAMLAGLSYADADYVSVLDADLQDPPALIPEMYRILEDGEYDCVCSRRVTRTGEPKLRSMFARFFYVIMNNISNARLESGSRDFLMMNKKMSEAILSMGEYVRFFKGMFVWVGFKRKWLEYENINRTAGETKWSFLSLTKYALIAITSYSVQPLVWPAFIAIILGIVGFLLMLNGMGGLGFITILFAFQTGFLAVMGYYMATMFLELKNRPKYIVRETNVQK